MFDFLKNKHHIISIGFGLIGLFAVLSFIGLLLFDIKNDSDNITTIKDSTVALEVQNTKIEDFKKIYDNQKEPLQKINQLFIDPQHFVDFIKFLENTTSDAGISSQISLLSNANTAQKNQNSVTFQISSRDDFLKILHFSEKIENGPYLVEIKNVTIKKLDEQNTSVILPSLKDKTVEQKKLYSGNVNATFIIKAFIQP